MHRTRRVSAIQSVRFPRSRVRKLTSKELDLVLLAGCSCLLTVLSHPVADALQVAQTLRGPSTTVSTSAPIPTNSVNAFHLTLPPTQDDRHDEEEA